MKCTNAQLNILGKIRISGDSTIITNSTLIFDEYYQLFQSDINKQILDGNKFLYFDKEITEISNNQIIQTRYDGEGEIVLFDNPESNLQGFYLEVFRGNTNLPVYYKYWEECEDRKSSDEYLQEKWGVNFYYTTELYEGNDKQTLIIYKYINGEFARTGNSFIINNDDNLIPCIIVKYTGINYPDGAEEGDYFYNTTTQKLYVLLGLEWTEEEILNGYFYYFESDEDEESEGVPAIIVDNYLSLLSANPVENRVITAALNNKLDKLDIDTEVREGSNNVVTGNAVFQALKDYKPKKPCIIVKFVGISYPQNAEEGDYFYNKDTEKLYQYLNSTWVETEILDGYFYHFEGNDSNDEEEQQTIIIDGFLSLSSRNPVENRVITQALEDICYSDCLNQRFEELSNMIEELSPSAGDEPAPVLFSNGDGIEIEEEPDENGNRVITIKLTNNALRALSYNIPSIIQRVELIEEKINEKFPDDPVPVRIVFDPLVGNWGDINFNKDPENITVTDVTNYNVSTLVNTNTIPVWSSGDTPPEGSYLITAEKAGLARVSGDPIYTVAQRAQLNREALLRITSNTGIYADCVGLILGDSTNNTAEFYYISPTPGDGNQIISNGVSVQTTDEGWDGINNGDKGIKILKDFSIIGVTFNENNLPTSGLTLQGASQINSCPLFYTTHSLNLIGVRLAQRTSGYGLIVIDSVDGIEQVQIKNCYFCKVDGNGDIQSVDGTTKYISFYGRDESPINSATGELREDLCIEHLFIYNNTFDGSNCFTNQGGLSTNISNMGPARYSKTCRIVNNTFTGFSTYPFNFAITNGTTWGRFVAFTLCPIYIAGNTINGLERIHSASSGTQTCGLYMEYGRTYILHNTIRNIAVSRTDSTETRFMYTSCTSVYFCNNICEDLIKVSTNRGNFGVILSKNLQIPVSYKDSHYENYLYMANNTFRQNISKLKQWWNTWVNTNGDPGITFDEACSMNIAPATEEQYDGYERATFKNNNYNLRSIRGMADGSPLIAKHVEITGNTFNFYDEYGYSDSDKSHIFNIKKALDINISNNRFITDVSSIRLLNLKIDSSTGYITPAEAITVNNNGVLNGVTFKQRRGNSDNSSLTNVNGYIIPRTDLNTEEASIIADTIPVT